MRLLGTPVLVRHHIQVTKPAFVLGAIFVAAGASAAIGGKWLSGNRVGMSSDAQLVGSALGSATNSRPQATPMAASAAPVASIEPSEAPKTTASIESAPPYVEAAPSRLDAPPRPAATTEKGLVFEAMRALRREGQPERAARLLDEYLRRYPRGSLSEEALALAIEANSALGDPRARALAERYLSNYPEGRFRSAALRARARFSQ
jgi:TolA-binding protein